MDQKNKVAIVKNKGKKLMIPFSAYVFDRYGEYKPGSEEKQWQQRLGFLNIEYIDTINSTPKDDFVHSSSDRKIP